MKLIRNHRRILGVTLAIAMAMSVAIACSTFEGTTGKVIGTFAQTVDGAMKVYGDLYRAGKVPADLNAQVKLIYGKYQASANAALDALELYIKVKQAGGVPNQALVESLMANLTDLVTQLETLLSKASNSPVQLMRHKAPKTLAEAQQLRNELRVALHHLQHEPTIVAALGR